MHSKYVNKIERICNCPLIKTIRNSVRTITSNELSQLKHGITYNLLFASILVSPLLFLETSILSCYFIVVDCMSVDNILFKKV